MSSQFSWNGDNREKRSSKRVSRFGSSANSMTGSGATTDKTRELARREGASGIIPSLQIPNESSPTSLWQGRSTKSVGSLSLAEVLMAARRTVRPLLVNATQAEQSCLLEQFRYRCRLEDGVPWPFPSRKG